MSARTRRGSASSGDASPRESSPEKIVRAQAHLKRGETAAAVALLEQIPRGKDVVAGQRALVLGRAYTTVENYAVADDCFAEAAAIAQSVCNATLDADVAYYRARRYLFEGRPEQAREMLGETRALASEFGRLRALHLESLILYSEGRHRDQVRTLMALLTNINPNRDEHMEMRANATSTLAVLARELYVPEALPEIERQLEGAAWPAEFNEQRFEALRALGWACALRGDYFNAFRFLRQCSKFATSDADRAIAAAERAELARRKGEHLWSRQELAEAEEAAASADWSAVRGEARLGLLLLAELFVSIDAARAAYYRARFSESGNMKMSNGCDLDDDPRLAAMVRYSSGVVDLASHHDKVGLEQLRRALAIFQEHGYDWRAGRCALHLFEATRNAGDIATAAERLRHYMNSWLGDELRRLSERKISLPPMQRRVYEALCRGLSNAEIARELGRSEFTIRNHIKLIFKAFGVNSRAELIAKSARGS